MTSVQYCSIYPHQFRLTHDISLEKLNSFDCGGDNVLNQATDLHNYNNNRGRTSPTSSGSDNWRHSRSSSSDNSDVGWYSPKIWATNRTPSWFSGTLTHDSIISQAKHTNGHVEKVQDILLFPQAALNSSRKISESDEVFVKENLHNVSEGHRSSSTSPEESVHTIRKPRPSVSRKGRRPRKLPDIPPQSKDWIQPCTAPVTRERFQLDYRQSPIGQSVGGETRGRGTAGIGPAGLAEVALRLADEERVSWRQYHSQERRACRHTNHVFLENAFIDFAVKPVQVLSLADELQQADPSLRLAQTLHKGHTILSPNLDCYTCDPTTPEDDSLAHTPSTSTQNTSLSPKQTRLEDSIHELTDHCEFCENVEYIDDELKPHESTSGVRSRHSSGQTTTEGGEGSRDQGAGMPVRGSVDGASPSGSFNEHKSCRDSPLGRECIEHLGDEAAGYQQHASACVGGSPLVNGCTSGIGGAISKHCRRMPSFDIDELEATHRGCHRFVPRHADEIFIEIGDPIFVYEEADDLWCEGVNLRSEKQGIFPSAYATDLSLLEDGQGVRPSKFKLQFLGSVEVSCHKGTDVIVQAIHKVAVQRRMTMKQSLATTPPIVFLEITEYGIKMYEKSKKKKQEPEEDDEEDDGSVRSRLAKILSRAKQGVKPDTGLNYFFSLKNVSFCGFHPHNDHYFAFITKHPLELKYACHVLLSDKSTKVVAEAIGDAFHQFYQQYMAMVHQTEDIYIE